MPSLASAAMRTGGSSTRSSFSAGSMGRICSCSVGGGVDLKFGGVDGAIHEDLFCGDRERRVEAVKPADLVREPAGLLRRSQGRPAASQHWQTRFSPSHRLQMGRAGLTPRMCPGRHKAGLPEQDLVSSDQGMSCSHREAAQPLLLGVVIGSKIRLDQLTGRALPSVPVAGPSDRRHQKGQKKISILSQNGPRPLRVYSFRPHEAPTQPSSIHGR